MSQVASIFGLAVVLGTSFHCMVIINNNYLASQCSHFVHLVFSFNCGFGTNIVYKCILLFVLKQAESFLAFEIMMSH